MSVLRTPASSRFSARGLAAALALATVAIGAAQYAPVAEARSFHHGGFHGGGFRVGGAFIGGAIIGAALARPYYGSSYYYPYSYYPSYYPPAYYPPAVYSAPVSYVERDPYYGAAAAPAPSGYAPSAYSAPQQRLTVEQRAQRLKAMCAQGLFTAQECAQRRAQLLREM